MKTYSSGRNRVHTSFSEAEIKEAIREYQTYARVNPNDDLTPELLECVADLTEELSLRGGK